MAVNGGIYPMVPATEMTKWSVNCNFFDQNFMTGNFQQCVFDTKGYNKDDWKFEEVKIKRFDFLYLLIKIAMVKYESHIVSSEVKPKVGQYHVH